MSKLPIELVHDALDAILALEGTIVYPNGLPPCFCESLARLRKDESLLQKKAEEAETAAVQRPPLVSSSIHTPVGFIHLAVEGSGFMGCCGKPPFELPRTDQVTTDPKLVDCPYYKVKQPGMIRQMVNEMDKSVQDQADTEAMQTVKECVHAATRRFLRKRYFCKLTINGKEAEHQVRITSKPYTGVAYVQRLVKSTNRFGAKRYFVKREDIREELY